ncbi:hypothetical protein BKA70DRAFT_1333046 [Coprinopsis sp. MPI-PUGE-AT-0042]|nr:hypothetical protein BKA70DRAFT_1333046 [Coprinopsis sp. MPI-PUGE-AT-0042]
MAKAQRAERKKKEANQEAEDAARAERVGKRRRDAMNEAFEKGVRKGSLLHRYRTASLRAPVASGQAKTAASKPHRIQSPEGDEDTVPNSDNDDNGKEAQLARPKSHYPQNLGDALLHDKRVSGELSDSDDDGIEPTQAVSSHRQQGSQRSTSRPSGSVSSLQALPLPKKRRVASDHHQQASQRSQSTSSGTTSSPPKPSKKPSKPVSKPSKPRSHLSKQVSKALKKKTSSFSAQQKDCMRNKTPAPKAKAPALPKGTPAPKAARGRKPLPQPSTRSTRSQANRSFHALS